MDLFWGRGPPMWALFGENVSEDERTEFRGVWGGGDVRRKICM